MFDGIRLSLIIQYIYAIFLQLKKNLLNISINKTPDDGLPSVQKHSGQFQ